MNLLDVLSKLGNKSMGQDRQAILQKPGDRFEACITKSGRRVAKLRKDDGNFKYSVTQYGNGTTVETRVTKKV